MTIHEHNRQLPAYQALREALAVAGHMLIGGIVVLIAFGVVGLWGVR